jgi:ABC-2 type transport system permease protein
VKSIKLYFTLQYANLRSRMAYPFNFFVSVLSITVLGLASVFFVWIITRQVPAIKGWGLYELVFMISLWRTAHSIVVIAFQQSWNMDQLIRHGYFDRYLVRPLNPLFQFSMERVQVLGFGDLCAGLIGLAYSIGHITAWNAAKGFLLIFLIVCGAAIEWSIFMLIGCLAFWTYQGRGLLDFIDPFLYQFTRFPLTIFDRGIQIVMTIILPVAFMGFYPSYLFFGDKHEVPFSPFLIYLTPLVAVIFVLITYYVWKKGLDAYKGAGS